MHTTRGEKLIQGIFYISIILFLTSIDCVAINPASLILPEAYWGHAFIDGGTAVIGTPIEVKITKTGEIVGKAIVEKDGLYSLDILFDVPGDDIDQGADNHQEVTWFINGLPATSPAPGKDKAISGAQNWNYSLVLETTITLEKPDDNNSILYSIIPYILLLFFIFLLIIIRKKT